MIINILCVINLFIVSILRKVEVLFYKGVLVKFNNFIDEIFGVFF